MYSSTYKGFVLGNSLAAVSAAISEGEIYATDGLDCHIYRVNCDGTCDSLCAARPYRRLRVDPGSSDARYTALCGNTPRLYFLNDRFTEMGFTDLKTENDGDMNEITDAGITYVGGQPYLFASFRYSAYLFDVCGNRVTKLYSAPDCSLITDFLPATPELQAVSCNRRGVRIVSVIDDGNEQQGICGSGLSLRMLIPADDGIYALFGAGYIYNRISPIYSDGTLALPSACGT